MEERDDRVPEAAAGAMHDLLDRQGDRPTAATPLPLLWHWLAFLPQAKQADLGADGHPRTGSFLPPAHGRSRMYAGATITRTGNLRVGERLHRASTVASVVSKKGKTGELTFVTVHHDLTSHDSLDERRISEDQDIVYRDPGPTKAPSPTATGDVDPGDPDWVWGRHVAIDPTLLFRFSALTYNAHRIHYDRDYATGVEGYPGLVVHGPLQAMLLADALERLYPDRFITSFQFRAVAPAFDDYSLNLRVSTAVPVTAAGWTPTGEDGVERVTAAAFSARRHTMSVEATLAPPGHRPLTA